MWTGYTLVVQTEQVDRSIARAVSTRITGQVVSERVKPLAGRIHSGVSNQSAGTLGSTAGCD